MIIAMSSTTVALNVTAFRCAALMIALIIIQCDKIITLTQLADIHGIFYSRSHAEAPDEH